MRRHGSMQKPVGEDGAPPPAAIRMPLAAALPGLIMLLVGFVVVFSIGVSRIGLWQTVALWCALLGLYALGLAVVVRLLKKR
jgi:hypothetical protein